MPVIVLGSLGLETSPLWEGRILTLCGRLRGTGTDIVGLFSTHSLGSEHQSLERGWTRYYSGIAHGERRQAGEDLLLCPHLSCQVLEFPLVDDRAVSPVKSLTGLKWAEQQFEIPGEVLEGPPQGIP